MDMTWKYTIELRNEQLFQEVERKRQVSFPEELKKVLREANAGTPERCRFMLGNVEKVLGAVLSFNRGEADVDRADTALTVVTEERLIPFAIDPFGNYICYDTEQGQVAFWEHETGETMSTGQGLEAFLDGLY